VFCSFLALVLRKELQERLAGSIDSIELIVMLDREYGAKINDPKEGRAIFQSIKTMAEYVHQHRQK
ncbi:hypothetical protein L0152_13675, partial [bacterium]|nr:hypothetical protein [bacterium]